MDSTITIRIDSETKKAAKNVLDDLGLDLSSAINIYLKQVIKKQAIPFEISGKTAFNSGVVTQGDFELMNEQRDSKKEDELYESIRDELNGIGG